MLQSVQYARVDVITPGALLCQQNGYFFNQYTSLPSLLLSTFIWVLFKQHILSF